jgi:hypothetical protein
VINHRQQRGEGKIGCIVTLLVLSIAGAAAFQVVPVLFSNNDFLNSVENIAGRAGIITQAGIEAQINQKARELNIPEALAPGAIIVTKTGDKQQGTCTVRLSYTRNIDFYGIFTYPMKTEKVKTVPYMDVR